MDKRLIWIALSLLVSPVVMAQLPPIPEKTDAEPQQKPRLFVAQRVFDLGKIHEGDKPAVHWLLENRGDADLIIERTRSSCGCAVVKLTEKEKIIPPGGSLKLATEFDSRNRRGRQSKYVAVTSNDPAQPTLKLEFTAEVEFLYEIKPPGLVNLRTLQRGMSAEKTIEISPGTGRKSVEILDVQVPKGAPFRFQYEPFDTGNGAGQRIHVIVGEYASLGTATAKVTLKLSIDGIERERVVSLRGEVVGDLTWRPKTIDATRQASRWGKQFAPVTIRSTDKAPFDVVEATAGPLFDVTITSAGSVPKRTRYLVVLTLRDDAPAGPFGTMLEVRTSSLDQPVVRVPVFGIVAPRIAVEPPVVLFRQDGTDVGTHRRVKLQVLPQLKLNISEITCDNDAIVATIDQEASSGYHHIRFLNVKLVRELPEGTHHAVLTVMTDIDGAERLEVPVSIDVPANGE